MRRIALDSNLLLLFVVGTASKDFIRKHKRLNAYSEADYDLLLQIVSGADVVLAIPNSLSEVSNLATQGVGVPLRSHIQAVFAAAVKRVDETYQPSRVVVEVPEFRRLGLTDCAWLLAIDPETELVTADLDLYLAALRRRLPVHNFNHLRESAGIL